ncbi:MAG TPA: tol-pal system protein YbgF [Thermoanaerobaculia bacterium]|nr:tol-pal system protein YbgF [Thermoanaerobaculia bacterium]
MRRVALLAALALAWGGGGCATAPSWPAPGNERAEKLEELERRVLELQRQAAVSELELARLRQQVAELEARLGSAGTPRRAPAPAPVPPAVEAPPPPRAPEPRDSVESDDLEEDLMPPVPAPPRPPPGADLPPTAGPLATAGEPVSRAGQAVYDDGYTLYHQGRYTESESRFREFLATHPDTELSDNAQYWIGAARLSRGDAAGALLALRQTVERYPQGNKVPDALFKMGQALEELGDRAAAAEVYDELVRRFPETAAATLASERRAELRP